MLVVFQHHASSRLTDTVGAAFWGRRGREGHIQGLGAILRWGRISAVGKLANYSINLSTDVDTNHTIGTCFVCPIP